MFRACAWCDILMGVTAPIDSAHITHGICRRCLERVHRVDLGEGRAVVIVVRRSEPMTQLAANLAGLPGVAVFHDRRHAVRRERTSPVKQERRHEERRRGPFHSQRDPWLALGVQVVPARVIR
jgi:hypothetical protein